ERLALAFGRGGVSGHQLEGVGVGFGGRVVSLCGQRGLRFLHEAVVNVVQALLFFLLLLAGPGISPGLLGRHLRFGLGFGFVGRHLRLGVGLGLIRRDLLLLFDVEAFLLFGQALLALGLGAFLLFELAFVAFRLGQGASLGILGLLEAADDGVGVEQLVGFL